MRRALRIGRLEGVSLYRQKERKFLWRDMLDDVGWDFCSVSYLVYLCQLRMTTIVLAVPHLVEMRMALA
jgi:hypothetical protein